MSIFFYLFKITFVKILTLINYADINIDGVLVVRNNTSDIRAYTMICVSEEREKSKIYTCIYI